MLARGLRHAVDAARIISLAFGKSPYRAVLFWPIFFLGALGSWPFGATYLTADRDGAFVIHARGWRAVVGGIVWMAIVVGLSTAIILVTAIAVPALLRALQWIALALAIWVVGSIVVLVATSKGPNRGVSFKEVGAETPKGRRYSVTALAQRPGTGFSALFAVRDAIDELPSGSIAVACAATSQLKSIYVRRGGFTSGEGLRVYKIVP